MRTTLPRTIRLKYVYQLLLLFVCTVLGHFTRRTILTGHADVSLAEGYCTAVIETSVRAAKPAKKKKPLHPSRLNRQ